MFYSSCDRSFKVFKIICAYAQASIILLFMTVTAYRLIFGRPATATRLPFIDIPAALSTKAWPTNALHQCPPVSRGTALLLTFSHSLVIYFAPWCKILQEFRSRADLSEAPVWICQWHLGGTKLNVFHNFSLHTLRKMTLNRHEWASTRTYLTSATVVGGSWNLQKFEEF